MSEKAFLAGFAKEAIEESPKGGQIRRALGIASATAVGGASGATLGATAGATLLMALVGLKFRGRRLGRVTLPRTPAARRRVLSLARSRRMARGLSLLGAGVTGAGGGGLAGLAGGGYAGYRAGKRIFGSN